MAEVIEPLPTRLFGTWEVDDTSPGCVPRTCSVTVSRVETLKPLEAADRGSTVALAISIEGSRRALQSGEFDIPTSGNVDARLGDQFSLQYSHQLKGDGSSLTVVMQRRKRLKQRQLFASKTICQGTVSMNAVLQQPGGELQLLLYSKDTVEPLARVTLTELVTMPTAMPAAEENEFSAGSDSEVYSDDDDRERSRKAKKNFDTRKLAKRLGKFMNKFRHDKAADYPDDEDPWRDIADLDGDLVRSLRSLSMLRPASVDSDSEDSDGDAASAGPGIRPIFPLTGSDATRQQRSFTQTTIGSSDEDFVDPPSSPHEVPPAFLDGVLQERRRSEPALSMSPARGSIAAPAKSGTTSSSAAAAATPTAATAAQDEENSGKTDASTLQDLRQVLPELSVQISRVLEQKGECIHAILMYGGAQVSARLVLSIFQHPHVTPPLEECIVCPTGLSGVSTFMKSLQSFVESSSNAHRMVRVAIVGDDKLIQTAIKAYVEAFASMEHEPRNRMLFHIVPLVEDLKLATQLGTADPEYKAAFLTEEWASAVLRAPEHASSSELVQSRLARYLAAGDRQELLLGEIMLTRQAGSDNVFVPFVMGVRVGALKSAGEDDTQAFDLQIDYWPAGASSSSSSKHKDDSKVSNKALFEYVMIARSMPQERDDVATPQGSQRALSLFAVVKENKKGLGLPRLGKRKDKAVVKSQIGKLICASHDKSRAGLTVIIDGVPWQGVKFFSLSPQWPSHAKHFPVAVYGSSSPTAFSSLQTSLQREPSSDGDDRSKRTTEC